VAEAKLEDSGAGLAPTSDGWFVVNVSDAQWLTGGFGAVGVFESRHSGFPQVGLNIRVLEPDQPACLYHSESLQEAFLVLHGECKLLVEGEERLLKAWDFVHCPAFTEHVFVGAGVGPCAILMIGARSEDEQLLYPVSELAARYGASATEETTDGDVAYARFERPEPGKPAGWAGLPWV
jgi:uncharacterized cupin superfamily protein